jgi:hypothetical protein
MYALLKTCKLQIHCCMTADIESSKPYCFQNDVRRGIVANLNKVRVSALVKLSVLIIVAFFDVTVKVTI